MENSVPLRRSLSRSSKPTVDAPEWIQKVLEVYMRHALPILTVIPGK